MCIFHTFQFQDILSGLPRGLLCGLLYGLLYRLLYDLLQGSPFATFFSPTLPKAALRRDAVTPSCSVRGQPEGKPVRLSAVAAGEGVPCYSLWKRFGNSAGRKVSLPI